MFEGLRGAFSGVAKSLGEKELGKKDIDGALEDLEISLLESDVAGEVIDGLKADLRSRLVGTKVERRAVAGFVRESLTSSISSLFDEAGCVDLMGMVREKKDRGEPFLVMFVGINGTGKTTTLAKIAYMMQQAKCSVVVAASDTFRAGAIEQLRAHTDKLGIKLVAQNYDSDPAAVARDAVLYAKSHKTDCVLIDTAGRMQTSKNLMEQIGKIAKVVDPDVKIFVGDSLAGNDTVSQAREFYEHTGFDASILTKGDADARGGAALSIVRVTSTPVIYVGVGQEYGDLRPFDKEVFLEAVLGDPGIKPDDPGTGQVQDDPGIKHTADDPGIEPHADDPGTGQVQDDPGIKHTADDPGIEPHADDPGIKPTPDDPGTKRIQDDPGIKPTPDDPGTKRVQDDPGIKPTPDDPGTKRVQDDPGIKPTPDDPGTKRVQDDPGIKPTPDDPGIKPHADDPEIQEADPFKGISDEDIAAYSEIHDAPPPENDGEAARMARDIRRWIGGGRPGAAKPKKRRRFGF